LLTGGGVPEAARGWIAQKAPGAKPPIAVTFPAVRPSLGRAPTTDEGLHAVTSPDPEHKRTLAQFRLKINGSPAPRDLDEAVVRLTIDERLHLPTMFEIELHVDPHTPKWIDDPAIGEGKEVEILIGYASEETSLCVGKVTSLDVDLDEQMPTFVVRGYDLSFALHRDVKSRSFVKQTDGDIATKIAGEAGGLSPKVDPTSEVHDYVLQHAQTNYAFLLERARRIGYEVRVVGKDLHFRKPEPEGSPVTLE
jgi:phage protein D